MILISYDEIISLCVKFAHFSLQVIFHCRSKNKAALAVFQRRSCDLGLPPLPVSLGSRNNFWSILDGLIRVLSPFEDATLQVSKEESNLSECIPYAHTLVSYPTQYDQH